MLCCKLSTFDHMAAHRVEIKITCLYASAVIHHSTTPRHPFFNSKFVEIEIGKIKAGRNTLIKII